MEVLGRCAESTWVLSGSPGMGTRVREAGPLLPAGGAVRAASASCRVPRCYQYRNAVPEHPTQNAIPPISMATFRESLLNSWEQQGTGPPSQSRTFDVSSDAWPGLSAGSGRWRGPSQVARRLHGVCLSLSLTGLAWRAESGGWRIL